jgi:hypothetical protein
MATASTLWMGLLRQYPHLQHDPTAGPFRSALEQVCEDPTKTKKTLTDIVAYATKTAPKQPPALVPITITPHQGSILKSPFGTSRVDIGKNFNPKLIEDPLPDDEVLDSGVAPPEGKEQPIAAKEPEDEPAADTPSSVAADPPVVEEEAAAPTEKPKPQPKRKRAPTPPPPAPSTSQRARKPPPPKPPAVKAKTKQALAKLLKEATEAAAEVAAPPPPPQKKAPGRKKAAAKKATTATN